MTTDGLVSAVIPTYQRAPRVTRAVASALAQTHAAIEVIVVDDGSTDGTARALQDRFPGEERLRVVGQDNAGAAAARNRGIAEATGRWIAFLDSDDEWQPWKIAFQLRCLERFPDAGMIWTDMAAVDPDGAHIADRYLRTMYRTARRLDFDDTFEASAPLTDLGAPADHPDRRLWFGDVFAEMMAGNLVHTSTVLMTRERAAEVGGFDEALHVTGEDFDFHLRTARAGPVAFADLPTVTYRVGAPDQLTRQSLLVPLARAHLVAVQKALDAGDARIDRTVRRRSVAAARGFLGEELLGTGLTAEARSHLWAAFIRRPTPRLAALLAVSLLPPALVSPIRRLHRTVKGLGKRLLRR